MTRVLSIEIDQLVTKICEMDRRAKKPKVYKSFMIATPEGAIADGMVQLSDAYIKQIREALQDNKVTAKKVSFTISSSRIASREVTFPYVKANKIEEVVKAQAGEYFPVNLEDYKVTYTLLGVTEDGKGQKRHKALVLAVPLKLLESYYKLAEQLGMEIEALDYAGNSLLQAVQGTCVEGTEIVAKIDDNSTMLIVLKDGAMVNIRQASYGVREAINLMIEEMGLEQDHEGYAAAVAELRQNVYIKANDPDSGREVGAFVSNITASLGYLVNGIARIVDFYNSKSEGQPIQKIYLTGVGGTFKGMSDLMKGHLGIQAVSIKRIDGLTVPREFHARSLGDYIGCIGAVMKPLDLLLEEKKPKSKSIFNGKSSEESAAIGPIIGAGGVIVALALALAALIPYKEAKLENERLLRRIEELKPVEEVHNTYVAAQNLWMDADAMYMLTRNHNDELTAFIGELEKKMPADIIVLSMTAGADQVTLNIDVESKESAAKVLQQLRTFETIEVVQTSGLSDVKDEENHHVVSFSVNCIYAQLQSTTQQEVAQNEN